MTIDLGTGTLFCMDLVHIFKLDHHGRRFYAIVTLNLKLNGKYQVTYSKFSYFELSLYSAWLIMNDLAI